MARKSKAASPEKPPKQKKMTQAEQSVLFIETARKLGADESGKEFERAFRKIAEPCSEGNSINRRPSTRSKSQA